MIRLSLIPVCVYCGVRVNWKIKARPVTCKAHRDLPRLDPFYAEPDQWANAR